MVTDAHNHAIFQKYEDLCPIVGPCTFSANSIVSDSLLSITSLYCFQGKV